MPNLRIIALITISLLMAVGYYTFVEAPKPKVRGSVDLVGLEAEVEILRDQWGVPHIYAQNERDLFYAQGFLHAQDRLWQMELNRHVGQGRLAEIFGSAALDTDIAIRTLGINRVLPKYVDMLSAESQEILDAYLAGINGYINSNAFRQPFEFKLFSINPEPWEPIDVMALLGAMSIDLQNHFGTIYQRALAQRALDPELYAEISAPYSIEGSFVIDASDTGLIATRSETDNLEVLAQAQPQTLEALARFDESFNFLRDLEVIGIDVGSNNWAIHGSKTDTGLPYLANDPHLSSRQPATWYEMHLNAPDWHVSGATLAGVPGIIIGHNDEIAWGVTVTYLAMQDLFIEQLDSTEGTPTTYQFEGVQETTTIIGEEIWVKGAKEALIHDVVLTHHGPVITSLFEDNEDEEADESEASQDEVAEEISLSWVFLDPPNVDVLGGVLNLNQASNWDEFRAAVSHWLQDLNFVYADVDGNIGYQMSGRLPLRGSAYQGVPVPGWTGEHDWAGYQPFEMLPNTFNPETGFVATANSRVVTDDLIDEIPGEWSVPFRTERITHLLNSRSQFTLENMRTLQADAYADVFLKLRGYILAVIEPQSLKERRVIEQIEGWHGVVHEVSIGAAVLNRFSQEIVDVVFDKRLNEVSDYISTSNGIYYFLDLVANNPESGWFDDPETPERETARDAIDEAFNETLEFLTSTAGEDVANWTWGSLEPEIFDHALGSIPALGKFLNRTSPTSGGRFTINRDSTSYRLIVDMSDLSNSMSGITTGQSGHPFSKHYDDQLEDWRFVTPHQMLWEREEVESHAQHTLTLKPKVVKE